MTTGDPIQLDQRLLKMGAIIAGVGGTVWLAGMMVAGSAMVKAAQQWMNQLDRPPSETARAKWQQLTAATTAGTNAWKAGAPAAITSLPAPDHQEP
jgi:hypothetical protein